MACTGWVLRMCCSPGRFFTRVVLNETRVCSAGAANLGYYSVSVPDAALLYDSHSYYDDLAWGALWLHKLTGNAAYLDQVMLVLMAQCLIIRSSLYSNA